MHNHWYCGSHQVSLPVWDLLWLWLSFPHGKGTSATYSVGATCRRESGIESRSYMFFQVTTVWHDHIAISCRGRNNRRLLKIRKAQRSAHTILRACSIASSPICNNRSLVSWCSRCRPLQMALVRWPRVDSSPEEKCSSKPDCQCLWWVPSVT